MFFNLFGNNKSFAPVKDLIWLHHQNKKKGVLALLKEHPEAIVLAWFQETITEFDNYFQQEHTGFTVQDARQVPTPMVKGKTILLLEHYPIFSKEQAAFERWQPALLFVISSLDDPLLLHTGSESLVSTMERMGMKETESLQHPLITKAIRNAQQQLEKKVVAEHSSISFSEWFRINLPS